MTKPTYIQTTPENIPSMLRRLRRERGYTLDRAAKASGLSEPTLSNLERGRSRASHAQLAKLGAVYGRGFVICIAPKEIKSEVAA